MELDSLGLLFVGMSVLFLIAILFGHQKREHMSNQNSKWESIIRDVESSLKEKYDFNIAEFRKKVSDQTDFFKKSKKDIERYQMSIGINISMPNVKDMKDTNRPFDERYRLISEDVKSIKEWFKNHDQNAKEKPPIDLIFDVAEKAAKSQLVTLAKIYMLTNVTSVTPKSGLSTISKILG